MGAYTSVLQHRFRLSCLCADLLVCGTLAMERAEAFVADIQGPPSPAQVTSPNPLDTWVPGGTYQIRWRDFAKSVRAVRIELRSGDRLHRTIVSSTSNDGTFDWTVPTNQATGRFAVIVAEVGYSPSRSGGQSLGFVENRYASSGPFKIASAVVMSPSGGTWPCGSPCTITWKWFHGRDVRIELYKGEAPCRTIASSTANDGSFSWIVPSGLACGTNHQIQITSISASWQRAYSKHMSITGTSNSGGGSGGDGVAPSPSKPVPPAPAGLSYPQTVKRAAKFTVSWGASADATKYRLRQRHLRKGKWGNWVVLGSRCFEAGATSIQLSVQGNAGDRYQYDVGACNQFGESWSQLGHYLTVRK